MAKVKAKENILFLTAILLSVACILPPSVHSEKADLSEFDDVRLKLNDVFDIFDDVITSQAVRVAKGVTTVDDVFNERMVELIEETEELDEDIRQELRRQRGVAGDDDDNDEEDDVKQEQEEVDGGAPSKTLDDFKVIATSMVGRASKLLDYILVSVGTSAEDTTLTRDLETMAARVKDVLWALKSVASRRKVQQWKVKARGQQSGLGANSHQRSQGAESPDSTSPFDFNVQQDDSHAGLKSDYLSGVPAPRSAWMYHNGTRHKTPGKSRRYSQDSARLRTKQSRQRNTGSNRTSPQTAGGVVNVGRDRSSVTSSSSGSRVVPGRNGISRASNRPYVDLDYIENYLRGCTDCAGLTDEAQCPGFQGMAEFRQWSMKLQELLINGCEKPGNLKKPGVCCVHRKYPFQQTITQMTQMMKDMHDMLDKQCQDKCADPEWSTWSSWSNCDVSCGQGVKVRRRQCDNSLSNGRDCEGSSVSTQACRMPSCCVDGNWAGWGQWSSCSASCGRGIQERSRQCDAPAANSCGRPCAGSGRERRACRGQSRCCVDGNWSGWARWSTCSATCGQGVTYRNRKCNNPGPNYCGKTCPGLKEERRRCGNDKECCVDGDWGSWAGWTSCSVSCGQGTQSRVRRCDRPSPNFCGQRCPGPALDTKSCNSGTCCVNGNWGQWGSWEDCSASCGRGSQLRRRQCDSPAANSCGRPCPGQPMDIRPCQNKACCVDGNWSPWQAWSRCPVTCGPGVQVRQRLCANPPASQCGKKCPGPARQTQDCQNPSCPPACVDGNWGSWERWTDCSVTCGQGQRSRGRLCNNPAANYCGKRCPGEAVARESCDTKKPCFKCIDGNWSRWTAWTSCSATCGYGLRTRRRACNNPSPNSCGRTCPGLTTELDRCDSGKTCIDCESAVQWSNWSPWSSCSKTCDTGVNQRVRECQNPFPARCRNTCPGERTENRPCQTGKPCCVDGNWSPWSPWSGCSVSCGGGVKRRSRACNSPAPNHCGRKCGGDGSMTAPCGNTRCPTTTTTPEPIKYDCAKVQWSEWSSWFSCSATCGGGIKERIRDCENPYPADCDHFCPGNDVDTATCGTTSCCGNVRWAKWSKWSPCSTTCGRGIRERSRDCNNPSPSACRSEDYCRGSATQKRNCNTGKECCVDGNWGSWGEWSSCSATCGRGTIERRRRCDSPPANYCGRKCVGREYDTEVCDAPVSCPVPCEERAWTQWGSWSPCPTTCGSSVVRRVRSCPPLTANSCPGSCPGEGSDSKLIACGPEPINGNWSPWDDWQCRGPCSEGIKFKTRYCNNPTPNACGTSCPGTASQACDPSLCVRECAMRQWTQWASWGACGKTCGRGVVRERRMRCEFVGGLQGKRDCGQESYKGCPGERVETEACRGLPLCIGDIVWSDWTVCSATCRGNGVHYRMKMVMTSDGLVELRSSQRETKACYVDSPECSQPWGPWGACSATCRGEGVRVRRTLVDLTDLGTIKANASQTETQICNVDSPACPDSWGPWGPCSATCKGEGVRQRRTVITADLQGKGTIQANASQTETETCYVSGPACPMWGAWGPCSATCQAPGVRQRRLLGPVDNESERPVDTQPCFGVGAECIESWGQWGPCSATCAGQGIRERRTVIRTDLALGTDVEATATNTETEVCTVRGPPCPPAPSWATWEKWCPCGCSDGMRSRRRECVVDDPSTGTKKTVSIAQCKGEARQEEECETKRACPQCITSCTGLTDGKYPACSGCQDYILCQGGVAFSNLLQRCPGKMEWDDFIDKCVNPPSPSCSIKGCIEQAECRDLPNGFYHACGVCNAYFQCRNGNAREMRCPDSTMEFNQLTGRCIFGRSPSCQRKFSLGGPNDGYGVTPNSYKVIGDPWQKDYYYRWNRTINAGSTVVGGSGTGTGTYGRGSGGAGQSGSGTYVSGGGTRVSGGGTYVSGGGTYVSGGRTYVSGGGTRVSGGGTRVSGGGTYIPSGGTYISGTRVSGGGSQGSGATGEVWRTQGGQGQGGQGGGVTIIRHVNVKGDAGNIPTGSGQAWSVSGSSQGGTGTWVVDKPDTSGSGVLISRGGGTRTAVTGVTFGGKAPCFVDCTGRAPGRYPSCDGCQYYLVCSKSGKTRKRKCYGKKKWDDIVKKCLRQSLTCS